MRDGNGDGKGISVFRHTKDPDSVKVEYPGNVTVEDKSEDMSWEELQEGIELVILVGEFVERYGECPELKGFLWDRIIIGSKKLQRWKRDFNIFREGARVGTKRSWEWIKNSGWLKEDVQKEFERKEKEEEKGA